MRFLLISLLLISLETSTQLHASTSTGADQGETARAQPSSGDVKPAAAAGSPRQLLDAWVESFNEHDAAAREQWLLDNTTLEPEQARQIAAVDQKIRSSQGGFELVRVIRTEGRTIEAEARHTGSGAGARIEITLDGEQPRIADVKLQKAEVKGNGNGPG